MARKGCADHRLWVRDTAAKLCFKSSSWKSKFQEELEQQSSQDSSRHSCFLSRWSGILKHVRPWSLCNANHWEKQLLFWNQLIRAVEMSAIQNTWRLSKPFLFDPSVALKPLLRFYASFDAFEPSKSQKKTEILQKTAVVDGFCPTFSEDHRLSSLSTVTM